MVGSLQEAPPADVVSGEKGFNSKPKRASRAKKCKMAPEKASCKSPRLGFDVMSKSTDGSNSDGKEAPGAGEPCQSLLNSSFKARVLSALQLSKSTACGTVCCTTLTLVSSSYQGRKTTTELGSNVAE